MRAGGGKNKGSSYERWVCGKLSLWVTGGKIEDGLWRSAMSGGRATVHLKRGTKIQQVGDICAVRPELHDFCAKFYIECKHVKSLDIESFLIRGKGLLAKFWKTACQEAKSHDRIPLIVARQNRTHDLLISPLMLKGLYSERVVSVRAPRMSPCTVRPLAEVLLNPYQE